MEAAVDRAIASYRENTAWRQQTVQLFADRVDVHSSVTLSNESEWSCPLVMLAPAFQKGKQRNPIFLVGLVLLGVWMTVLTVLWESRAFALDSPKTAFFWALPILFVTLTLCGIVKRPYVVVHSADGAPLFTIIKNYPDGKRFAEFTDGLLTAIRQARAAMQQSEASAKPASTIN